VRENSVFSNHNKIAALKQEHAKALDDISARHVDEIATSSEKSFKAGAEQGRADAMRDCWHVVASILQEVAKKPIHAPIRDALMCAATMARDGSFAECLAAPDVPTAS
jgi:hypothetical protein